MRIKSSKDLEKLRKKLKAADRNVKTRVLVCSGTGCAASGAFEVYDALVKEAKKARLGLQIELAPCGEKKGAKLASLTGC